MGESDRMVTLFTPFHGKVDAIARGARKAVSTKTGHVELYTRADVLIAKGREIDMLSQVEMVEPFLALREDLMKSACASYVVELLDRFTYSDDIDTHGLYRLLEETLTRLCGEDDVRLVVRFYELQLLDEVGFRPELQECVVTHDMLMPVDQFFSYGDRGVVSPEGAHHSAGLVPLPMTTLKLLRHLQRSPYKQVARLKVNDATHQDAERIMHGYIRYVLERQPQSVEFMRRVRRMEKTHETSSEFSVLSSESNAKKVNDSDE
jgi:DNA repair protein RecO (recombination protein O)